MVDSIFWKYKVSHLKMFPAHHFKLRDTRVVAGVALWGLGACEDAWRGAGEHPRTLMCHQASTRHPPQHWAGLAGGKPFILFICSSLRTVKPTKQNKKQHSLGVLCPAGWRLCWAAVPVRTGTCSCGTSPNQPSLVFHTFIFYCLCWHLTTCEHQVYSVTWVPWLPF